MHPAAVRVVARPEDDDHLRVGGARAEASEIAVAVEDNAIQASFRKPAVPGFDAPIRVGFSLGDRCPAIVPGTLQPRANASGGTSVRAVNHLSGDPHLAAPACCAPSPWPGCRWRAVLVSGRGWRAAATATGAWRTARCAVVTIASASSQAVDTRTTDRGPTAARSTEPPMAPTDMAPVVGVVAAAVIRPRMASGTMDSR